MISKKRFYTYFADVTLILDRKSHVAALRRAGVTLRWDKLSDDLCDLLEQLQGEIPEEATVDWSDNIECVEALTSLLNFGFVQCCDSDYSLSCIHTHPRLACHVDQMIYYNLFRSDPVNVVCELQQATVVIVGLGGLGSEVIRHLAAAGIGTLICIDDDKVSFSNLNRQHCYSPKDVGIKKTIALRKYLCRYAPHVVVRSADRFVEDLTSLDDAIREAFEGDPPKIDMIACCADEPVGHVELACLRAARERDCLLALGAMHLRRGYWSVIETPSALDQAEIFFKKAALLALVGGGHVAGSASWENSAIGGYLAGDMIAHLGNISISQRTDRLTGFDFVSMRTEVLADFTQELSLTSSRRQEK